MTASETTILSGDPGLAKLTSVASLTGRILISPIFLLSGVGKITNSATYLGYIGAFGLPFPVPALALAILIEIVGGLALIVGYKVRLVGMALAAFCLVTAAVFHSDFSNQNEFLQFWKNVAIAGGLLQLTAFGAGRLSFDAKRS